MKHLLVTLVTCLSLLPRAFAQMPDCSKVYLLQDSAIYGYDPALPVSLTNPSLNTISPPENSAGLSIAPPLGNPGGAPTFYTATYTVNGIYYYYYNGTTWVNASQSATNSVNIGVGGGYMYNIHNSAADTFIVTRNDGVNEILVATMTGVQTLRDIVADCEGNFYVLNPEHQVGYFRKYSPAGVLLRSWTVSNPKNLLGSIGFGMIGNTVYFDQYTRKTMLKGTIGATVLTIDTVAVQLPVSRAHSADLGTCPASVTHYAQVAISGSSTNVCAGTPVTFTATTPAGTGASSFQWKVDGQNAGANSPVFTYIPANGDQVVCVLTATGACNQSISVSSNVIIMTVSSAASATVSVHNDRDGFCAGRPAALVAVPVNGGTPSYQWYRNGIPAGGNNPRYGDTLQQGDWVYVVMTPSGPCTQQAPVTSDTIKVVISGTPVVPGININTIPPTTLCAGTPITFITNNVAGGSQPTYQWYRNGTALPGATLSTFTDAAYQDRDTIAVALYSSEACPVTQPTLSNKVGVTVFPVVMPAVSISANPSGNITPGQPVLFTAAPTNGGSQASYEWMLNGKVVYSSFTGSWTATGLKEGDVVMVRMQSSAPCPQLPLVYSNRVLIRTSTTGIVSAGNHGTLSVYPNPATDNLYIDFSKAPAGATLYLFDAAGRVVIPAQTIGTMHYQLDVWALAPGIYTYNLVLQGEIYRGRVRKE